MKLSIPYIAGLFDGEGHVSILKKYIGKNKNAYYHLAIGIHMCHRPLMEIIHSQFGGYLNGKCAQSSVHRHSFAWGLSNKRAADFLEEIGPYTVVKKEEIILGLALQEHIELHKYYPDSERSKIMNYREYLYLKSKEHKKLSFEPLPLKGQWFNGRIYSNKE